MTKGGKRTFPAVGPAILGRPRGDLSRRLRASVHAGRAGVVRRARIDGRRPIQLVQNHRSVMSKRSSYQTTGLLM